MFNIYRKLICFPISLLLIGLQLVLDVVFTNHFTPSQFLPLLITELGKLIPFLLNSSVTDKSHVYSLHMEAFHVLE